MLTAIAYSDQWSLRAVNVAGCHAGKSHAPAAPNCGCGFWALWELPRAQMHYHEGYVLGAILGWGRVQRHQYEGFRCQYAQIIGFANVPPALKISSALTVDLEAMDRINALATKYGQLADVPVLSPQALVVEASKQGITYREGMEKLK